MFYITTKENDYIEKIREFSTPAKPIDNISEIVENIISDIKNRGDIALLEYTEKFDHTKLSKEDLNLPLSELDKAFNNIPKEEIDAIIAAAESIKDFHKKTLPQNWMDKNPHGAIVGEKFYPIQNCGLYIPGGQVPLVSTVLMTAIPAKLAGVPNLTICTPPSSNGKIAPEILAAAKIIGVNKIHPIGGIQAIAAMALGTESVPAVDKIAGPGNAFVIEAKRQLYGKVGIDLLPGPSEVLVIADETANPDWVAADIITQAEHGSGKEKVYLLCLNESIHQAVLNSINKLLPHYKKCERLKEILSKGYCSIFADSIEKAIEIANFIAPEHMEIQTNEERQKTFSDVIVTAGAILCGHYSPAVLGDFVAGPSHTLPTSRTGRFFSGLQVSDFMRRSSFVQYSKESLEKAAPVVKKFSEMEQLQVHGHSLAIRFEK